MIEKIKNIGESAATNLEKVVDSDYVSNYKSMISQDKHIGPGIRSERARHLSFQGIVGKELSKIFVDRMREGGFDDEYISNFFKNLDQRANNFRPKEDQDPRFLGRMNLLAIPPSVLKKMVKEMKEKEMDPEAAVDYVIDLNNESRWIAGFHTSNKDIKQKEDTSWGVRGTEMSDFDTVVPMAYASRSYLSLYRQKSVRYLYVVRDSLDNDIDKSTGWSRSPSFSIVAKFDLAQIDEEVESWTKEVLKKNEEIVEAD